MEKKKGAIDIKGIFKLIVRNLIKNKKHTIFIIFNIIVIATLIFSSSLILASYQEYMVSVARAKNNYDAKISEINYQNFESSKNQLNTKSAFITHDEGNMQISSSGITQPIVNLKSYDDNAMENLNLELEVGRVPENSSEIVISKGSSGDTMYLGDDTYHIGDEFTFLTGDKSKKFTIVGFLENCDFDVDSMVSPVYGAVTVLDRDVLNEDSLIDVYILVKDLSNIYEETSSICSLLSVPTISISYNEDVLTYSLINKNVSIFKSTLYSIILILASVIFVASFVLIYTTYSISLSQRTSEFGTLRSIGMSVKKLSLMLFGETFFQALISIPIALGCSLLATNGILKILNQNINKLTIQDAILFSPDSGMIMNLTCPIPLIAICTLFIIITIYISVFIPIRKYASRVPIELLKQSKEIRAKKSTYQAFYFNNSHHKPEKKLAHNHLKRTKNTKTVIISLSICIALVIIVYNCINLYNYSPENKLSYNFMINSFDMEMSNEIINDLKKKGLIEDYYNKNSITNELALVIDDSKINQELIEFMNSEAAPKGIFHNPYDYTLRQFAINIFTIEEEKKYDELLSALNIDKIKENECVLLNKITLPNNDSFHLTNYNEGDTIELSLENLRYSSQSENPFDDIEIEEKEYNYEALENIPLKIIGVKDDFYEYVDTSDSDLLYSRPISILVSQDTFKNINNLIGEQHAVFSNTKVENVMQYGHIELYLHSNNPDEVDKYLEEKFDSSTYINYQSRYESKNSKVLITQITLFSFLGMLILICVINIYNIIFTSYQLRKKHFTTLKSIGMNKVQFYKIVFQEAKYYCFYALSIGIVIGVIVEQGIYQMLSKMREGYIQPQSIPFDTILWCVLGTIIVVFVAAYHSARKIKFNDLIQNIKREIY